MKNSLSKVLLKIFFQGFYRTNAGLFLFIFLVLIGSVDPGELLNYHKTLMLAFISSPIMLAAVFVLWLIYSVKIWHFTVGEIFGIDQQFLFYSSTSFTQPQQFRAWMLTQLSMLMPIVIYGLTAVVVGVWHHYYLAPLIILSYLTFLCWLGAFVYLTLINRQIDGGKNSILTRYGAKWGKPFFSLFIYNVFNKMKVRYVITKGISYLIVNGVFLLFADVSHDARVAGIAMLAIAAAHSILVFDERKFEETYLVFARGLPQTRFRLFAGFAAVYLFLLLPEGIWLFTRFNILLATELLLFGLSIVLLFHSLLYWMGLNMDRFLQWVLGLFIVTFWIVLFKQIGALIILNSVVAYALFYKNYYTTFPIKEVRE